MWKDTYPLDHIMEVRKWKEVKNNVEVAKEVEKNKLYTKEEAISLAKKTSTTKFDASVELAINLNLDTKKADQQLRGTICLQMVLVKLKEF